ncbi:MAG: hypothetical protein KGI50_06315 [Patescibacteria group bacterium]|nr:hypothetical protein [Patescibacteria group bacterium]MDE2438924.1 hypothetical protein [Patescibacteria group bacterium]
MAKAKKKRFNPKDETVKVLIYPSPDSFDPKKDGYSVYIETRSKTLFGIDRLRKVEVVTDLENLVHLGR